VSIAQPLPSFSSCSSRKHLICDDRLEAGGKLLLAVWRVTLVQSDLHTKR